MMPPEDSAAPYSGRDGDKQPSDNVPSETTSKGKGKAENTFADRIQRSANMFVSSLGSTSGETSSSIDGSKGTQPFAEERNRLERTLGEASTSSAQHHPSTANQSMRAPSDNRAAEASFSEFQQGSGLPILEHALPLTQPAVTEQEARDGDEVLKLLDEPSHSSGLLETFRPEETDDFLTPEERARLQKALFGEPRQGTPWATLLDPAHDLLPSLEDEETTEMLFGKTDTNSARQQWLDQWRDVLASYTDEVWGDLGPLASEAEAEVTQILEEPSGDPAKGHQALNRLRMVLSHLRG